MVLWQIIFVSIGGTIVPSWKVLGTFLGLKVSCKLNTLCSLFWLPFLRLVTGAELTTRWEESRKQESKTYKEWKEN